MSNAILPARGCKHGKCLINLGKDFGSILLKVINNNIKIEKAEIFIKSFSNNALVSMVSQLNEKKKHGWIESENNRSNSTWGRTVVVFEHLYTPKRFKNHNKVLKIKNKENPNDSEAYTNLFEACKTDNSEKKIMTRKLELIKTFSKQVHGKMSIKFKQSYKFKRDESTVNLENSFNLNDSCTQMTSSHVNLSDSIRNESIINLGNTKSSLSTEGNSTDLRETAVYFPIIKMARVLNVKSHNVPTDFVGKMKILFNYSEKHKTSDLSPSDTTKAELERQHKDNESSVHATEHKNTNDEIKSDLIFLKQSTFPKKIVQSFLPLLKNMTYSQKQSSFDNSETLESGKMKINFDHSTKTKSFNKIGRILTKNDVCTSTNSEKPITKLNSQPKNKLTENDSLSEAVHDFSESFIASNVIKMDSCTLQGQENSEVIEIPENKSEICQGIPKENTCDSNVQSMQVQNQQKVDDKKIKTISTVNKVTFLPKKRKISKIMMKSKRKLPPSATRIALEKSKQSLERLIMFNSDPQCGFITSTSGNVKTVEDMVKKTKPRKVEEQGLKELKENIVIQKFDSNIEQNSEPETKVISQDNESFDKKKIQLECKMDNSNIVNKCHSENNLEFINLLSSTDEIGIMTINSTRTAETMDSNEDTNFYKRIFTVTNTLKKVGKKFTPSYKITENKSFSSVEAINKDQIKINQIEEKIQNEKQLDFLQTDPLDRKLFLKSVSNLLEMTEANEFIDDIVKTPVCKIKPGVSQTQIKNDSAILKEKKVAVKNHKNAHPDVSTIPDNNKRMFQLGHNKITITEMPKADDCSPPITVKVQNCDIVSNPSQTKDSTNKQLEATKPEHLKVMKHSPLTESSETHDSSKKDNDPNCSTISKMRKNATLKMLNHFESLQGVIDFPQGTKIVKNVVKDRMQAYQDISKKFEKMGLYRKIPKKKLIEDIEDSRKKSLATIKRDLELQDKLKTTSKGKRMQEYFHSFKFRLTSTMKEYGKRKNLKNNKKMFISSKLGKLNPPTSPSKPSFARKGNRKNKCM